MKNNTKNNLKEDVIGNREINYTDTIPTEYENLNKKSNNSSRKNTHITKTPRFPPGLKWYWQLQGKLNLSKDVDVYDVDLDKITKEEISFLHNRSIKVICYFSAGTYETFRNLSFPKEVIGKQLENWPDEFWLDIRKYEKFKERILKKLDLAKEKGCDAVEADNVQNYIEDTGFNITYKDQIRYNICLAEEAHKRNLAIGLKNDIMQIKDLVNYFDFAINEQCFEYNECNPLKEFIKQNKSVFGVEYNLDLKDFCDKAKKLNFSFIKATYELDGNVEFCHE